MNTSSITAPNTDANARQRLFILKMIHSYTVILHVALPAVLFALYGQGGFQLVTPAWSTVLQDPIGIGAVGVALVALVMAKVLPPIMVRAKKKARKSGTVDDLADVATAYIVRLCLTEFSVVSGFALGFLKQAPELSVPFAAVGLALVLLSPPNNSTFSRMLSA